MPTPPLTHRLSIILPLTPALGLTGIVGPSRKALVERAVDSIVNQEDPLGSEVVLVNGTQSHAITDHIESIFSDARIQGRLRVLRLRTTPSVGHAYNEGAASATGATLAFVHPENTWKPGRLQALDPQLKRHDLILETTHTGAGEILDLTSNAAADRLLTLLSENWAVPGSGVIRARPSSRSGG